MKKREKTKKITAQEFDKKFDKGEDITPYLDLKTAKVITPIQRINIDIPEGMLKKVDREADRIGVARTALIKLWIAERVDRLPNQPPQIPSS